MFSDAQLAAYQDEGLAPAVMAEIEAELRRSAELRARLADLMEQRDQGGHTVGEIWRRGRVSCPTRHELGALLLGAVDAARGAYLQFHLDVVGCRICAANLEDLRRHPDPPAAVEQRRRKFFESSAGNLRR
jgi:hypothetical protein